VIDGGRGFSHCDASLRRRVPGKQWDGRASETASSVPEWEVLTPTTTNKGAIPCLVGMEACGGAHEWARRLTTLGYTAKLMAPQFVKPYVKTNKNDAADAEAICEAVSRPNMRFVPIKTPDQQAVLALHRARQGFVRQRTAQGNQIRGLLAEYGVTIPQEIRNIARVYRRYLRMRRSHCLASSDNC
jgi:transposase